MASPDNEYHEMLATKIQPIFQRCVKPISVIYHFHKHSDGKILTTRDIQNVLARTQLEGDIDGATLLLERLRQYKGWFECLMKVLQDEDVKLSHAAEEMEKKKAQLDKEWKEIYEQMDHPEELTPVHQMTESRPRRIRIRNIPIRKLEHIMAAFPNRALFLPVHQMMARPDPPFRSITERVVEFNNNNMKSRKRKRHQQLLEAAYERSTDSDSASELPEHFVEIDPKEIKKDTHRVLGNGAYGVVNLAKWKGRDVAIKLFERTGKSFQRELEHLTKVRHENIIRLYGKYYIEGKEAAGPFMAGLVMEYSKDGSLQYVIFDSDHQYTRADGLSWCRQCAQGVEYLHDMKPKAILHRDLKPANLLLFNEKKVLKLCDFGLARDIKTTMTKFKGTATFIAPEVSQGEKYNEKCDVFSFGVIVWVTLKRGQPKSKKMLGIPTADTSLMGRGTIENLPQELEKLMESCWSTDPQQRPKMTEIVTILSTPEQYFKDGSLHEVVPKDSSTDASDESSD